MTTQVSERGQALDGLLELVHERVAEIDRSRRLPDDVVEAIRRSGLNRMLVPAVLGGDDAPVLDVMEAVEQIAAVDGSTAWCAVIGSGSNLFAGLMSERG